MTMMMMMVSGENVMQLLTVSGADALTLVSVAELVRVAMAAAECEGHAAADVVVVVPPGDWNAARTRVHRQRTHVCSNKQRQCCDLVGRHVGGPGAGGGLQRRRA